MRIYRKTAARRRGIIRIVFGRRVAPRRVPRAVRRIETLAEAMRRFWDDDL